MITILPYSDDNAKTAANKGMMYENTLATDSWILEQSSAIESPIALVVNEWGQPIQIKSVVVHAHGELKPQERQIDEIMYGWSQLIPNIVDRDGDCHLFTIAYEAHSCTLVYPGFTNVTLGYEDPNFFDRLGEEIKRIYLHAIMMIEIKNVRERITAIEFDFQSSDMASLDVVDIDKLIKRFQISQRAMARCEDMVCKINESALARPAKKVDEEDIPF